MYKCNNIHRGITLIAFWTSFHIKNKPLMIRRKLKINKNRILKFAYNNTINFLNSFSFVIRCIKIKNNSSN